VLSNTARLRLLQNRILGAGTSPLDNLYWDLLINESVGRAMGPQDLIAVYHASHAEGEVESVAARAQAQSAGKKSKASVHGTAPPSAVFEFYMACYEELWRLPEGHLVGEARALTKFPDWRGDARRFVNRFFQMIDDPFVRFIAFCQVIKPYLEQDKKNQQDSTEDIPMAHDLGEPSAGDWEVVLGSDPQVDKAIDEARKKGILPREAAQRAQAQEAKDPLEQIDDIMNGYGGMPGKQAAAFRRRLVSSVYGRLVDQHLFKLPPLPAPEPDRIIPGPTEEYEWGDDPAQIDWGASVLRHGPMAAAFPLRRDWLPDEPVLGTYSVPRIEIYLDTSGSMPDPERNLNALTLAAQILAAAAIRKGSLVRGVIYSSGPESPMVSPWMGSEQTAREWLLHYSGGGTDFPWKFLAGSVKETRSAPPLRIVVSDQDFLYNLRDTNAPSTMEAAVRSSPMFVALLHLYPGYGKPEVLAPYVGRPSFRLVPVHDMADFAKTAAELADALFPAGRGSHSRARHSQMRTKKRNR
jgi:hypothetical protein